MKATLSKNPELWKLVMFVLDCSIEIMSPELCFVDINISWCKHLAVILNNQEPMVLIR